MGGVYWAIPFNSEEGKNLGLDHHRQDELTSEKSEGVCGKFL